MIILVLPVLVIGCSLVNTVSTGAEGKVPIRQLRIIVEVKRQDELVNRLGEFAKEQDFTIQSRPVDVIPGGLFIELYRDDLIISALTVPDAPTKIDLAFYERNPSQPVPEEKVTTLLNNLLDSIREIPNVTVSEIK